MFGRSKLNMTSRELVMIYGGSKSELTMRTLLGAHVWRWVYHLRKSKTGEFEGLVLENMTKS